MVNKGFWIRVINVVLFFSFILQAVTVTILWFRENEVIEEIHEYNGLIFVVLVIVHVIFNWGWIKATFLKGERQS